MADWRKTCQNPLMAEFIARSVIERSSQVKRLFQGSEANICDACIDYCNQKLDQVKSSELAEKTTEAEGTER